MKGVENMTNEFTKREDDLRDRWKASYPAEQREQFCFDGLIYYRDPNSNDDYEEIIKWENAKRKVLFLMKDTNNNPGEDYRWWEEFYTIKSNFFRNIIKCLWALNKVDVNYKPDFNKHKTIEEYTTESIQYPMAIVNVKKIAGGPSVDNKSLSESYNRDEVFIKEQIVQDFPYCKENDVLIIDDYHPSYISRNNQTMINAVYDFYQKKITCTI